VNEHRESDFNIQCVEEFKKIFRSLVWIGERHCAEMKCLVQRMNQTTRHRSFPSDSHIVAGHRMLLSQNDLGMLLVLDKLYTILYHGES
jgi:hypothetical protein